MIKRAVSVQSDPGTDRAQVAPLRVLMCVRPAAEVGGLETSFGRIINSLADAGVRAEALVLGAGADSSPTAGYLRTVMPVHTASGLSAAAALIKRFDVVHAHASFGTTSWSAAAVGAARLTGVPLVVSLHLPGVPALRPRLRGRLKARVIAAPRQLLLAAAADFVGSPSVAAAAVAGSRLAPLRVPVRPLWNGVPDSGRAALPEGGPLRLVFVGRLSDHKAPLEFVEAVELAVRRGVDIVADIVGDGPLREAVQRRIAASGHAGRFTVHGAIAQPAEVLRRGHALVLMSRHEGGGPLVMMEAGASGRGTIARAGVEGVTDDWPDAVEIVARNGGAGGFAEAFCLLAGDLRRVAALGAAARSRYEEFFTADHSARRLRLVYDDAIRHHRGRRR